MNSPLPTPPPPPPAPIQVVAFPQPAAPMLAYAPPAVSQKAPVVVIISGIITAVVTLSIVTLLDWFDVANVMGFYLNYILPAGALLVGIGAGSGYGLASLKTGVKIRKHLLWTILALQLAAFWAAEYGQYLAVLERTHRHFTFIRYERYMAENFAWKKDDGNGRGEALGNSGYFFRGLAMVGFVLGGMVVPGVMIKMPYCELCQRYKKTKLLTRFPGTAPYRKTKPGTPQAAEYEQQVKAQLANANKTIDALTLSARNNDVANFDAWLKALEPGKKKAINVPRRIEITAIYCRTCKSGDLSISAVTGQGKKVQRAILKTEPLAPVFVHEMELARRL